MDRHRFPNWMVSDTRSIPAVSVGPSAEFVACPVALMPVVGGLVWGWQQALYQRALEEACAVVRPPITERLQAANWN